MPAVCSLSEEDEVAAVEENLYPSRGYETILKEQSAQSISMENKAFTMDEPNAGKCKLLSFYFQFFLTLSSLL